MSVSGALAIAGVNLLYCAAGYGVLAPALRGLRVRAWASYAGLALLLGMGVSALVLGWAAMAGATTGLVSLAVVVVVLAVGGAAAARALPASLRRPWTPPAVQLRGEPPRWAVPVVALSATGIALVLGLVLVGGFRTSPWLDDTWFFWVPKGLALRDHGLDPAQFNGDGGLLPFTSPFYPLGWSIVSALGLQAAGGIDLRAVNGELGILLLGFVGAAARLLAGRVRAEVLWPALLLLLVSPELLRQIQGGGADLPLAFALALAVVAATAWLRDGDRFSLALVALLAACASNLKFEGAGVLVVLLVVLGLFRLRRAPLLWVALAAGILTQLPWLVWRRVHDVGDHRTSPGHALDTILHLERTELFRLSARLVGRHLLDPSEWIIVLPLAVGLALLSSWRRRSPRDLAVPVGALLVYLFWIAVYWGSPEPNVGQVVGTSAYRVVDSLLLTLGLLTPLLAERVLATTRLRRERAYRAPT